MSEPILAFSGSYNLFKSEVEYPNIGVYMASGICQSEHLNQMIYIGSSNNLSQRIQFEHVADLNSNAHSNPVFQSAWNKYGQENFVWWILDYCEKENYIFKEQYFLDSYRPFADEKNGFNIAKNSLAPFLGRKHSEESKVLMSKALKGKKRTQETRDRISKAKTGKKASPETILKMKARIVKPASQETREKLSKAFKGRPRPTGSGKKSKDFELISPLGELIKGNNINQFLRDNSMNRSCFYKLLRGKKIIYKGWTLPNPMF